MAVIYELMLFHLVTLMMSYLVDVFTADTMLTNWLEDITIRLIECINSWERCQRTMPGNWMR